MPRQPPRRRRSTCPIATSLDIFGDKWSLLVIRDLLFTERRRFGDFAAAGEDVATNILAERLERLECEGLIARRPDPADGRKVIYRLTPKGFALAPMMIEMVVWAAQHEDTGAPAHVVRQMKRDRSKFLSQLRARWLA